MAKGKLGVGSKLGDWRLVGPLGSGGNGIVWKARNSSNLLGALKILRNPTASRANLRFRDEVAAMAACQDIMGVLPLLGSDFPAQITKENPAWLVSAIAKPLSGMPRNLDLREAVALCRALASTLSEMHSRAHYHRDIKPDNVFFYDGRWCLGDFGLADFPLKDALTREGEKLGPAHYIAPEMLNDAVTADGAKADVYSLGKLLWKLATGQTYPLPGVHLRDIPALTLSANVVGVGTSELDGLLEAMTQIDPDKRPDMTNVERELATWLSPPPTQKTLTDLSPLEQRARALTGALAEEQRRRASLHTIAEQARVTAFSVVAPTVELVRAELARAKLGSVTFDPPQGGNGAFFYVVTGRNKVGRSDRTWLFQTAVTLRLDAGYARGVLKGGFNLGVRNVEEEEGVVHDVYAPVIAAAGYIVTIETIVEGRLHSEEHLVWGEHDTFHFHQPSESKVLGSLCDGLKSNLYGAVQNMLAFLEQKAPPKGVTPP